jgi:Arc/MetJ-type ribon-helix-helix transcriptional regulator
MLSFRVDEATATDVRQWAERIGIDRSELLRDALRRHLVRLRAEDEVRAWDRTPLAPEEASLGEVAEWGPAEDWSDWADATG